MKRVSGLYNQISDYDNLILAFLKASRGKKAKPEVIEFCKKFETNINELKNQFKTKNFDIGNYYFFKIKDPKPRNICASIFKERVLHHAVMNICEPFLESCAIYDSFACRKDKGIHKAVYKAQKNSRKYAWFLKLDIKKYFDSIDHKILTELLKRRFKDKEIINLFIKIFNTYHTHFNKGLPIGNLISQHMANFYLGLLDHHIKENLRIKGYIRYMDDFLIFGRCPIELKKILHETEQFLFSSLRLELKNSKILNKCKNGIPFLGYVIYPCKIRLSKASKQRFIKKFKDYEIKYIKGEWSEVELVKHIEPLLSFTKISNGRNLRNHIIKNFGVIPLKAPDA